LVGRKLYGDVIMRRSISSALRICLLSICLFSSGTVLFAFFGRPETPGQWVRNLFLIDQFRNDRGRPVYLLIDENDKIHKTITTNNTVEELPATVKGGETSPYRFWFNQPMMHNETLYSLVRGPDFYGENDDDQPFRHWFITKYSEQDDKWFFLAEYKLYADKAKGGWGLRSLGRLRAIPCDNNRFIVISEKRDLTKDNRPDRTPFSRMSIPENKTELRLDVSIDHGQEELREHMVLPNCFSLAYDSDIAITDRHAVLINKRTGLYWIFSLEKASLLKAGNIFKGVTTDMILKGGFPDAVLYINPEKDGNVLISAQEVSFFTTETGDAQKETSKFEAENPDVPLGVLMERYLRRLLELADRNPIMVWYRIDPEIRRVEKLDIHPIGGAYIRVGAGSHDIWRPMSDGSVKMGDYSTNLVEVKEESAKGASATTAAEEPEKAEKTEINGNDVEIKVEVKKDVTELSKKPEIYSKSQVLQSY